MVIYFFIFMYASQVMKGVIEEKTNRIIEVLVSSVKPFQFLLGKIIGVAAVGLVQFLIWVAFGLLLIVGMQAAGCSSLSACRRLSYPNWIWKPSDPQATWQATSPPLPAPNN